MLLRNYQTAAVSAVHSHWAAGRRRACLALPTGAGKTRTAMSAIQDARNPLALVHTTTLADQARAALAAAGLKGTVMTIQAAVRRGVSLAAHDVVWIDECHHVRSTSWGRVMGLLAPGAKVLGVTATPERADGAALGDVFDALVATAPYSTLLEQGHLVPCRITPAEGYGPAQAYLAHGNGRPGILFAPTKAECNAAVQALCAAGVPSATIDADTPTKHRRAIIADYNEGHVTVLASPVALAEGFDATRAEVVVLGRTCGHVGLYLQCVGRVLRPHPGKTEAHLIDLVGAHVRHGSPTEDRTYSLVGRAISGPLSKLDAAMRGVSGMLGDTGDGPRRPTTSVPAGARGPDKVAAGVRRSRPTAVPPTRPTKPARVSFWQKVAYSVGAGRWLW